MANKEIRCPLCKGKVNIDDRAETEIPIALKGELRRNGSGIAIVRKQVVVAFCSACEWCHEIRPEFLRKVA